MRRTNTLKIMVGAGVMGVAGLVSCNVGVFNAPASALSYQDSAEMQFTFNPTISVSLSSPDLIISNLTPGSASDSNIVTATVSTNAGWGYYLAATTGTAGGTTNLVNTTDNTAVFTSLASNVATVSAMPDNSWGYSYSTDNGTTWVSGNSGSTTAGYNGLPLDADDNGATGIKLLSSNTLAASGSVQFKIGAHAGTTQAAGTYTGTVNFYAVTNPGPDNTMQGFAAGDASTTCSAMSTGDTIKLKDSRDDTEYTVGKLADGKCWMLDNLALDVVAKIDDMNETNTNASNTTLGYLKNGGGSTTSGDATYKYALAGVANWTTSYSYSAPLVNMSYKDTVPSNAPADGQGNNKIGGYYNYCAASAGSYCYGSGTSAGTSSGNATEDICPKGWRLPGGGSTVNLTATPPTGEYYNLYNGGFGYDTTTNYRNALSLPLSGYFDNGSPTNQGSYGYWWSSTRNDNYYMYRLRADMGDIYPDNLSGRNNGYSIRCVLGP